MSFGGRAVLGWSALLALLATGCGGGGGVELGLAPDPSPGAFALVNRTPDTWSEVRVRVTGDDHAGPCHDAVLPRWPAGEARSFPRCGDRTLVAVTVRGKETFFVVAGATLYRKLGRKEIPVRR